MPATGIAAFLAPDSVSNNAVVIAAHLIQLALTPVFMLSGIGTLINIFNTRLQKVSDCLSEIDSKVLASEKEAESPEENEANKREMLENAEHLLFRQTRLQLRVLVLDIGIILLALSGAFTCASAVALFFGSIHETRTATWLLILFAAALTFTILGLMAFLADTLLSWHGLKRKREIILKLWAAHKEHKLLAANAPKSQNPPK
ncbi:DUF2721 domain-containing protein [Acetobacteraceae bacterium]|nr:DUF2721 domain-containing protein [Acetobacteraceae bacterium]